ncbi:MAG: ABC transporter permease [Actinobacteria bacterium]|nr:MAG: ABC transporter permease [Actinomycetota bacterium]
MIRMSWRRVRLLIWKEFLQLKRDRSMLPIIFIMPVLQLIMFGYVIGTDVRDIRTAVVDRDGSVESRLVIDGFTNSGFFKQVAAPATEAEMQTLIDGNKAQVAIIIPEGFSDDVHAKRATQIGIVVDGSDSKTASVASGYAGQVVASLGRQLYPSRLSASAGGVDARVRVLFNPTLRSVNTMVPALLAFILMMSTQMTMSQAIVKERERGTLEQLFVTPIGRAEYLIGKLVPYVIIATIQITLVFTVGTIWFKVPFNGTLLVMGSGLALFALTSLGIGLMVSLLSRTRYQAQQAMTFLMVPSMMLSGFVFPLESMPAVLYPLSYLIPLRYIVVVVRSNFMKGSGFSALWPQFAAMAIFAVVVFGFGLSRFRKQLND